MGKRRFPKKDGIVFKLFYGGSAPGSQDISQGNQTKELVKEPNSMVEEVVDDDGDELSPHKLKPEKPPKGLHDHHTPPPHPHGEAEFHSDDNSDDIYGDDGDGDRDSDGEYIEDGQGGDVEGDGGDEDDNDQEDPIKRTQHGELSRFSKRKNDDIDHEELAFGPGDTYDYSQHVRQPGRGIFVAADLEYTEKVLNSLNMGHKVKKLREMAGKQYVDIDDIQDTEVDAPLFSSSDYYTGTLDDDFVLQANGGVPVDIKETEIKRLRKSVNRMKLDGHSQPGALTDRGDDDFDEDPLDEFDYDDDYDVDATKHIGTETSNSERKPRLIDEQFDHVLDQYEEANFGEYMDPRDPDVLGQHEADTEDPIFQEYIIARRKLKGPAYTPSSFNFDADEGGTETDKENLKPVDQADVVREESDAEGDGEDLLVDLYPTKRVEQWDCDTIISTYSNLENHPKLIVEPFNKIKLSKKTGMPLGVLGTRHHDHHANDNDNDKDNDNDGLEDAASNSENFGKARVKSETLEQRRERKKQVKETKKVNREKKKLVKQAYKLEEIKQTTLMVAQRVNQRVVYKF